MADTTYNGWTNYETWVTALWMGNEQCSSEYWQERATELMQESIDKGCDSESIRNDAAYELSKEMESQHDEMQEEAGIRTVGVFADLLNHALGMVDWYEIARHYVDEVDLYSAGWNMPGYMPDSDVALFIDADAALDYIKESAIQSIEETLDDEALHDDEAEELTDSVNSWKSDSKGEFGQTFGKFHYFVSIV